MECYKNNGVCYSRKELFGGEVIINRITWSQIAQPYVKHEVCKIVDADRLFRSVELFLPLNLGGTIIGMALPVFVGKEIKGDTLYKLIDSFETLHKRVNGKNEIFFGSYDREIGIDESILSDLEVTVNNILKIQSPLIPCFAADEFFPYEISNADNLNEQEFHNVIENMEPSADPYVSGNYV